jgi:hypothetical protein
MEAQREESRQRSNILEIAEKRSRELEVELEIEQKAAALEKERVTQRLAQLEGQLKSQELDAQPSHREQVVSYESSLNAAQDAAAAAEREHSKARGDYQDRINATEKRNHELRSELEAQREEINRRSNAREVAEARNRELEGELERKHEAASLEGKRVTQRIAQLEGELATLGDTVQDANALAQSNAHAELLTSEARCHELEEEIIALRDQLAAEARAAADELLWEEPLQTAPKNSPRPYGIPPLAMSRIGTVAPNSLSPRPVVATVDDAFTKGAQSLHSSGSSLPTPGSPVSAVAVYAASVQNVQSNGSNPPTPRRVSLQNIRSNGSNTPTSLISPRPGHPPSPRVMEAVRSLQNSGLRSTTQPALMVPRSSPSPSSRYALPEVQGIAGMAARTASTTPIRTPPMLPRQLQVLARPPAQHSQINSNSSRMAASPIVGGRAYAQKATPVSLISREEVQRFADRR